MVSTSSTLEPSLPITVTTAVYIYGSIVPFQRCGFSTLRAALPEIEFSVSATVFSCASFIANTTFAAHSGLTNKASILTIACPSLTSGVTYTPQLPWSSKDI